jgi:hypothetical protein
MLSKILMGCAAALAAAPALAQSSGMAGSAVIAPGTAPGSPNSAGAAARAASSAGLGGTIIGDTVFPDPSKVAGSTYAPAGSPGSSIGGQINMTLAMGAVPAQPASLRVPASQGALADPSAMKKAGPRAHSPGSGQ